MSKTGLQKLEERTDDEEMSKDFLFDSVHLDSSDHELKDDVISREQSLADHNDFNL